jgi:hypothetical protein
VQQADIEGQFLGLGKCIGAEHNRAATHIGRKEIDSGLLISPSELFVFEKTE